MQVFQRITVALLLFFSLTTYGYILNNFTAHDLNVVRNTQDPNAFIPVQGQIRCPRTVKGCSGYVYLRLYSVNDPKNIICDWQGFIKGAENFFIIRPLDYPAYPNPGSCFIEQYSE